MATDKRYLTADGGEITPGARLFNYYDRVWVTIEPGQFTSGRRTAPGGEHWNGWFDVVADDGSRNLLNGERLAVRPPR